jgi:hypothetical protein
MNKIHLSVQSLLFTVFLSSCSSILRCAACKAEQKVAQHIAINGAGEAAGVVAKRNAAQQTASGFTINVVKNEVDDVGKGVLKPKLKPPIPTPKVLVRYNHLIPDEATPQEKEILKRCMDNSETLEEIASIQKSSRIVKKTYDLIVASRKEECLVPKKTKVTLFNKNGSHEVKLLENIIDNAQHDALTKGIKSFKANVELYKRLNESGIVENTERQFNDILKEALTDITFIKAKTYSVTAGIVKLTIEASESQEAQFEIKVSI